MYEIPRSSLAPHKASQIWLQWLGIVLLHKMILYLCMLLLFRLVVWGTPSFELIQTILTVSDFLVTIVVALFAGVLQARLLGGLIVDFHARKWLLATVLGPVFAMLVSLGAYHAQSHLFSQPIALWSGIDRYLYQLVVTGLEAVCLGLFQGVALRRYASHWHWWVVATVVGAAIGSLISEALASIVRKPALEPQVEVGPVFWLIPALALGIAQGYALVRLLNLRGEPQESEGDDWDGVGTTEAG